ncbi:hypothetical protein CHS0354_023895 [Potamilus streckersoni]|uniref:D-alanyl-D-alanine carboxypeptidase n=1 Tax=Potamilus streckersoni TaxID=2493646 RepID=A0AAE0RZ16_9BIVA|nr:hypothetical protein CHS0354_023895 [Potamilus streckersoni]
MGALLFGQPGIDTNQTKVVDGSGLSRHNAISPNTMIQILRFCYLANFFPSFKMTFPIAGIDGTLKERFSSSPLVGKVYAKTGSLSQIRSLSGYIDINEKTEIAFSIFATGILQSPLIIEDIIEKAVTEIFNWKKNHNP